MRNVLISFFLLSSALVQAHVKDSIGVKEKDGRTYILHKIEAKETLFSLSRQYGTTVEDIIKSNPDMADNLPIEAIIEIPIPVVPKIAGDKSRILHTVQPSETLFSISKQYKVEIKQIREWNQIEDNNISIGQELVIYPAKALSSAEKDTPIANQTYTEQRIQMKHQVQAGETLYSLARKYNVSRKDIKEWNNLSNNNINIGQELIVGHIRKSNKPISVASQRNYNNDSKSTTIVNHIKPALEDSVQQAASNKLPADDKGSGNNNAISEPNVKKIPIDDNPYTNSNLSLKKRNTSDALKKEVHTGVATLIEGSEDTKKYLALHKNIPIGTIVEVKNEMNNLSVFVKIIGKLPNTGENKEIDIKLTKEAYDRLGAIDEKFRVQYSYLPN
jgi:LysM repeat protein